jgi:flagellar biosynthesis protein FlhG
MYLISGAEFVPGMANPTHWIKMKIMTHLKDLPVDFVIIDLGGGVHYNTLDFFGLSDRGFVVSVPEPGAIMNAYAFIKGAFFRKLHNIFKKHPIIGPMIQSEMQKNEKENRLTVEWFTARINEIDPELLSLIYEIENTFQPAFVSNRSQESSTHLLVKNLINLCNQQLGITIKNIANIPDVKTISKYLLNLPLFFETPDGRHFFESIQNIFQKFDLIDNKFVDTSYFRDDFSDEETEAIIGFLDSLDESVFEGTNKNLWKFRMYYRPSDVLKFLATRGINYDLLYNNGSKSIESSP